MSFAQALERLQKGRLWFLLVILMMPAAAEAQGSYQLESIEIKGSTRISLTQIEQELGLKSGGALSDEFVIMARQKLLGLGLFRSVVLLMRKGSVRGKVKLIVELEDDPSVLSSWGLGTRIGLKYSDTQAVAAAGASPPFGFEMEILGRNIARRFHRGGLLFDLDGNGIMRRGRLVYGVPRFAAEDIQFDTKINVVDPARRYLDSKGFGGEFEAIWSMSRAEYKTLNFGTAMLVNRGERFQVPIFPKTIAGPTVGYRYDNRLHSFLPDAGYMYETSILLNPVDATLSVLGLEAAYTKNFQEICWASLILDNRLVGTKGYAARAELRLDFPVTNIYETGEQATLSVRFRGGQDEFAAKRLVGSSAIIGLRYYSDGFIGELGLQVTKSPRDYGLLSDIAGGGEN